MELAPYADDPNSVAVYIGRPQVKAVHFQRTESGDGILDIEIVRSTDSPSGKCLLRLEGSVAELNVLGESIRIALLNPRPHPSSVDLFEAALIDIPWVRELHEKARAADSVTKEVEMARSRVNG
jgi:hypothetical protein